MGFYYSPYIDKECFIYKLCEDNRYRTAFFGKKIPKLINRRYGYTQRIVANTRKLTPLTLDRFMYIWESSMQRELGVDHLIKYSREYLEEVAESL